MQIERLRIVDNRLPTPEGEVVGPTTYFMDVAVNESEMVAIPINSETFITLNDIVAEHAPPEEVVLTSLMGEPPTGPIGVPA